MSGLTTILLEDVSKHLLLLKTKNEIESNLSRSFLTTITEKAARLGTPPNNISILYECIAEHLILAHYCKQYVNDVDYDWTCRSDYDGQVYDFCYGEKDFELSVLNEVTSSDETGCAFAVFNFPNDENKPVYHVELFKKASIPTLKVEDIIKDGDKVRSIAMAVSEVFLKFFAKAVTGYFMRGEMSSTAVNPILMFDETEENEAAKRARRNSPETNPVPRALQTSVALDNYTKLMNKFKLANTTITDSGKLFGVFFEFLLELDGVESSEPVDKWPGSSSYKNEVVSILLPRKCLKAESDSEKQAEKLQYMFFMSILHNEKEFYICIRSSDFESKWIVKKIVKQLVPSFNPDDEELDKKRIQNLEIFFSAFIRKNFVDKVLADTYKKPSLGFMSTSSSCSSASTAGLSSQIASGTNTPP